MLSGSGGAGDTNAQRNGQRGGDAAQLEGAGFDALEQHICEHSGLIGLCARDEDHELVTPVSNGEVVVAADVPHQR